MPRRKKKTGNNKPSPRSIAREIVWKRLSALGQGDIPELDTMTTMQAYRVKRQLFATIARVVSKFGYQFESDLPAPPKKYRRQRVGKLRETRQPQPETTATSPLEAIKSIVKGKPGPKPGFKRKQVEKEEAPRKSLLKPPAKRKYTRRAGRLVFPEKQPVVEETKSKSAPTKFKVVQGKSVPALPASQIQKGMDVSLGMGVHATVLDVQAESKDVVVLRLRDSKTNHEFKVKQLAKSLLPASFPSKKAG